MIFWVAQSKSASSRLRLASGSRGWASKPAEIMIRSGRKSRSRGRMTLSNASRNSAPPSPARSGALTMVSCSPRSLARAGAGIKRHLMGRAIHHGLVRPEDVLRAVAVMDVEIDDRDAVDAVLLLGVARGDGDVVEQAEAHRPRGLGVMAGRARRDEGVRGAAGHHLVDGVHGAAGRAQRRLEAAR